VVPAAEQDLFANVEAFWTKFLQARFHDYSQQTSKVLTRALPVARAVKGGDRLDWEGVVIRVLDTPGPTRGSVSYLLEIAGRKIAFTGDLLLGDGKLTELSGLQDAIPEAKIGGYHGWAARLGQVMDSLRKLDAESPDLIVPARGPLIREPALAICALADRIRAVYSNYLSADALRWYFGDDHILAKARRVLGPEARVDWMPMAETRPLPAWVLAIDNTRLVVAEDRSGFLIDCGSRRIIDSLKKLQADGKLGAVEHLFITHYHDDHTDAAAEFVRQTGARVHACGSLPAVLERPSAFRLPCLTQHPLAVSHRHPHGDAWRWREFQLKMLDFPGQTLHHNALWVKKDGGEAILFVGDSFTPSGVDDYCLQNRNLLHEGTGLLRCLDLIEQEAAGAFLVNQHVRPSFRFDQAQLDRMRDTLRRRRDLLRPLFQWDDPGFGIDDGWACAEPYAIQTTAGQPAALTLRILNHSPLARTFHARVHVPDGLELALADEVSARIAPRQSGTLPFNIRTTARTRPGLHVLTYDLRWEGGELREWGEALVEVQARP
jgi:glyoxylase-like metal-dependent hydrolase (beta-lactamase superfamily II)